MRLEHFVLAIGNARILIVVSRVRRLALITITVAIVTIVTVTIVTIVTVTIVTIIAPLILRKFVVVDNGLNHALAGHNFVVDFLAVNENYKGRDVLKIVWSSSTSNLVEVTVNEHHRSAIGVPGLLLSELLNVLAGTATLGAEFDEDRLGAASGLNELVELSLGLRLKHFVFTRGVLRILIFVATVAIVAFITPLILRK